MSPGVPAGDIVSGVLRLNPVVVLLGAEISSGFQESLSSGVVL